MVVPPVKMAGEIGGIVGMPVEDGFVLIDRSGDEIQYGREGLGRIGGIEADTFLFPETSQGREPFRGGIPIRFPEIGIKDDRGIQG